MKDREVHAAALLAVECAGAAPLGATPPIVTSLEHRFCSASRQADSESKIKSVFTGVPATMTTNNQFNLAAPRYSVLSFAFAAASVCHCMFSGASAPPRLSGVMWSTT